MFPDIHTLLFIATNTDQNIKKLFTSLVRASLGGYFAKPGVRDKQTFNSAFQLQVNSYCVRSFVIQMRQVGVKYKE